MGMLVGYTGRGLIYLTAVIEFIVGGAVRKAVGLVHESRSFDE